MMKHVLPLLFLLSGLSAGAQLREIPLSPDRFYQVVSSTKSTDALIDGDIRTQPEPQYHLLAYPAEIRYEFPAEMDVSIAQIRFYDGMGTAEGKPFKVYVISPGNWKKTLIATFTGDAYNEWTTINLKTPLKARYLVIEKGILFPNEMQLLGDFKPYREQKSPERPRRPFRNYTGVNGFEWNILKDPANESTFGEIDEAKFSLLKPFTAFRHYMDWEKLEHTPGKYTFSPTRSGAWDYDRMYETLQRHHIEVLACFKTIPNFIINTYPEKDRDYGNVPARFGADLTKPATYIEQGRAVFQYAARYGSNKNVNPALVKVDFAPQFGPGTRANERKIGLGLIRYIECDNERDKWWAGRKAYQTGREYAANLSAFYDGDQGRLGPGVGVKAADSTIRWPSVVSPQRNPITSALLSTGVRSSAADSFALISSTITNMPMTLARCNMANPPAGWRRKLPGWVTLPTSSLTCHGVMEATGKYGSPKPGTTCISRPRTMFLR
ncbi:hypothetical protein MKQ70_10060 [Chitinophaga sedimenti]|uniref:hypothetical protein n=1 Tax=Chitinophaga sedimenti TaxID=2033606 RepID=UPI0020066B2A|nr:hypothetical protein [Chitinophaga sedimenti]MCK7555326.1 hypothetical protein [Chitinophaga sedimenti]